MAKLYFRYGAMGSSKTANALMVQYNYLERGQKALLFKPRLDNRDGEKIIASRSGLTAACEFIEDIDAVDLTDCDCIIVDEAQFMTEAQVQRLADIVDTQDIPVICYGLRADFLGNLFEGSRALMAIADTIEEIKTVCWCGRKATFNARIANGKVVKSGEQIQLGGNESYVALCRRHWANGMLAPTEIRRITLDKPRFSELFPHPAFKFSLDDSDLFVLFKDGAPVSAICLKLMDEGSVVIRSLMTQATHRRNGYAAQLMQHVTQVYRNRAARVLVSGEADELAYLTRFGFVVSDGEAILTY